MQFGTKLKAVELRLGFRTDDSSGVILLCSSLRELAEEEEDKGIEERCRSEHQSSLLLSLSLTSWAVLSKLRPILIHGPGPENDGPTYEPSISSFTRPGPS